MVIVYWVIFLCYLCCSYLLEYYIKEMKQTILFLFCVWASIYHGALLWLLFDHYLYINGLGILTFCKKIYKNFCQDLYQILLLSPKLQFFPRSLVMWKNHSFGQKLVPLSTKILTEFCWGENFDFSLRYLPVKKKSQFWIKI